MRKLRATNGGFATPDRTPEPQPQAPVAAKRKLVQNERLKMITATLLNNAAAAALVAGVIAPAAAGLYGMYLPKSPYWSEYGLSWMIFAAALHGAARRILKDLEP